MHHKYHTEALVISGIATGEANRYLTLYTRELGMVRAVAQGVRKIESKLRYSLQDITYAEVELVRGRDVWRITSARPRRTFPVHTLSAPVKTVFGNLTRLIIRLMPGEEGNSALFDTVIAGFERLVDEPDQAVARGVEYVTVLRILHHLGYLSADVHQLLIHGPLSDEMIQTAYQDRQTLVGTINQSLKETQL